MKRGLSDSNQHGNNGVDRPARLSRACFSLNQSFVLTSISSISVLLNAIYRVVFVLSLALMVDIG